MVLTPHLTEPMPRDGKQPAEQVLLLSGSYNLGFIAVGDTERGAGCSTGGWSAWPPTASSTTVPATSPTSAYRLRPGDVPAHLVHDPSWNFAYWNVSTRPLARDAAGAVTVGGRPATFVHFSGYSPRAASPPEQAPGEPTAPPPERGPHPAGALRRVRSSPRGRRLHGQARDFVMPFTSRDGVGADPSGAAPSSRAEVLGRTAGPRPGTQALAVGGEEGLGLADWLVAPDPHNTAGGLGRVLAHVYSVRPDLQAAYPSVPTETARASSTGQRCSAVTEMRVPLGLIRLERERLASDPGSATMLHRPRPRRRATSSPTGWRSPATSPPIWDSAARATVRDAACSMATCRSPRRPTRAPPVAWGPTGPTSRPRGAAVRHVALVRQRGQLPYFLADAGPRYTRRPPPHRALVLGAHRAARRTACLRSTWWTRSGPAASTTPRASASRRTSRSW